MQCGQCEGCARDIVAQCNAAQPVAALNKQGESGSPVWPAAV
jgi:bacterioferritin-associated ferredoxin